MFPRRILPAALLLGGALLLLSASSGSADVAGFLRHPLSSEPGDPGIVRGKLPAVGTKPEAKLQLTRGDYEAYLLARFGRSFVEDMAFDVCLAESCARAGLVTDAGTRAANEAANVLRRYGGDLPPHEIEDRRIRIQNEVLRRLRTEALVRERRNPTEQKLRALFDEVYGVDGQRVKVRHILVSWRGSEDRLRAKAGEDGKRPNRQEIRAHGVERARELHRQLQEGKSFYALLRESDDPTTQTLLQNPLRRQLAGLIEGYNYQRYGEDFAKAVRALKKGEFSEPVLSSHGMHLILLVDREVTEFAEVREGLKKRFLEERILFSEVEELRKALFREYEIQIRK